MASQNQDFKWNDMIFKSHLRIAYKQHQLNVVVEKFALLARICVWQDPIVNSITIISAHVIGNDDEKCAFV